MKKGLPYQLLGAGSMVLLWHILSLFAGEYIIPGPLTVLSDTFILLARASTWPQIGITLFRVITGFLMAFGLGTLAGILAGKFSAAEEFLKPMTAFFQGMPPVLWIIPVILILGSGGLSPILVITFISFPIITVTITEGTKSLPKELLEMIRLYAPGLLPQLKEVIFPHLKPFFSGAVKLGLILGLKASVVSEFFGANDGIGFQIQAAYQAIMTRKLFAWGAVLITLILFLSNTHKAALTLMKRLFTLTPQKQKALLKQRGPFKSQNIAAVAGSLKVDKLSFGYNKAPLILKEISLELSGSRILVLSGNSGSGKTTLLKLIASVIKPSNGIINAPQKIAFQFQDSRLLPWRTVLHNTALPLLYDGTPVQEAFLKANSMLSRAGLNENHFDLPSILSGGMQKRAAFARTFARSPHLILLDEPFAGLHQEARHEMWKTFTALHKDNPCPVVIATHYPEELAGFPGAQFFKLTGEKLVEYSREPKASNLKFS